MEMTYYQTQNTLLLCRSRLISHEWQNKLPLKEPFWRFYKSKDAVMRLRKDSGILEIRADEICLIAPDTEFVPDMKEPFYQLYIHFLSSFPFGRIRNRIFIQKSTPCIDGLADELSVLIEKEESNPSLSLSLLASSLCSAALSLIADNCSTDTEHASVRILADYMQRNLTLPLSNSDLAKRVRMNEKYLIRFFRQHSGMTPQEYLRDLRIQHACLQLRFTDASMDEIALNSGFCDRFHFSRIFKALRGISPAAFRRCENIENKQF